MIDTVALREKVLDLAIRGKLVPQDPNDEPASVLLERIRAQKQQMVKEGKLKAKDIKDDSIIFVGEDNLHYEKFADGTVKCIEDEIPFELPEGWAWCRLSMVGTTNIGLTYKPADVSEEGTIVLRSCNIINGKIDLEDLVRVKTDIRDNQYIEENDILICARNGSRSLVGKCAVMNNIGEKTSFGAFMAVFRSICYRYVYHYFNTLLFRSAFDNDDSKQINQVTQAILQDTMIPLPPFAEQERIVSTLDETFALVDLINEETENIEFLIKSTKAHILDLAIRGKLVPQTPDDEPASVLLERIRAEKEELIKQGKIKRDKKESVIFKGEDNSYYEKIDGFEICIDEKIPFSLPENWRWERLGNISTIARGGSPRPIEDYLTESDDGINWIKIGDTEQGGKYISSTREKIIPAGLSKTRYVKSGDFLLTNSMSFGRPYILKTDGCIHDGWLVIGDIENVFNQDYLYYALSSGFMYKAFSEVAAGSTVKNLKSDTVKAVFFPVPPYDEQVRIANYVEKLFAAISSIEKSLS